MSVKTCDKQRLMIVDDDPTIRRLFSLIIGGKTPATTIDMAGNGAEALELFIKHRPHLIIMDLSMPVMDGLTAFRKIEAYCRAHDWEMPSVLFCTGFTPPVGMDKIVADGQHLLLQKPITGDELLQEIQRML